MPSDEVKIAALKNYREPVLGMTSVLSVFSSRFAVTMVKVLHFFDGMKWYVERHSSAFQKFTHAPHCTVQLVGTSWRTWTLIGCCLAGTP